MFVGHAMDSVQPKSIYPTKTVESAVSKSSAQKCVRNRCTKNSYDLTAGCARDGKRALLKCSLAFSAVRFDPGMNSPHACPPVDLGLPSQFVFRATNVAYVDSLIAGAPSFHAVVESCAADGTYLLD